MSSASNSEAEMVAPAAAQPTRPFYWSFRREIWEHRSLYIAPLAVAGVVLCGFVIQLIAMSPKSMLAAASLPAPAESNLNRPYAFAAAAVFFCGLIVGVFYCLGALNNERRDRSILFWKSLPVSDLTAVLAKLAIPLLAIPLVAFVISVAVQVVMLSLGTLYLSVRGYDGLMIWTHWPMLSMTPALAYFLVIMTLWYAPIYGWLLLISGWARRMPILWAVLPPLALGLVEKIGFDTMYVAGLLIYRLKGYALEGFVPPAHGQHNVDVLALIAPGRFLASPGLWLGLVFAAACVAGAVWLRRYREPGTL